MIQPHRLVPLFTGSLGCVLLLSISATVLAYPIDAYEETGIGRLEVMRRIEADEMKGRKQPAGALLPDAAVDIRLRDHKDMDRPPVDPAFTAQIVEFLGEYADRYAIAVLDLSDMDNPRYAEHNGDMAQNVGSVGKLLVGLALYQKLADLYPDDIEARWRLMKDTVITADEFIISDHHTVRRWDRENAKLIRRPLEIGDQGSMMEWIDWMMSPSSNAAAATLMKHGMLMTHFGTDYPVPDDVGQNYFTDTSKGELQQTLSEFIQQPVTANGFDLNRIRQGSFFTRTGKIKVPGTTSYATARTLMDYLLRMEQGRLVDDFSSRELKRMLYVTERRIRYASSPALRNAAVYFKSGSLYKCEPEPGFKCKKYHGNVRNYMNSVAIIEAPAKERDLFYMVTLISNVLRRNSAVDHQTFATRLHNMLKQQHAKPATGD